MLYNKLPVSVKVINLNIDEWMSYQYLPIKLPNQHKITLEKRLYFLYHFLGDIACDYVGLNGLDDYMNSYMYLTIKNGYQSNGCSFNRKGLHSDGFLTDDINYIWYNKQPTIFNYTGFVLSKDERLSLKEMEYQADPAKDVIFPCNNILRMDQYSIHRVGEPVEGQRCFIKVSFSKDKYNLKGNSINYDLDYSWVMKDRKVERNIPQGEINEVRDTN